jgi:tetratricopeptide (TPR) repeat protein
MRKYFLILVTAIIVLGCTDKDRDLAQLHAIRSTEAAEKGNFTEAIEEINEALRIRPNVPEYLVGLGSFYARQGEKEKAAEKYHGALDIYGERIEDVNAWNQRVFVLYLLGNEEEMIKVLKQGREKYPEDESLKALEKNPSIFDGFRSWRAS